MTFPAAALRRVELQDSAPIAETRSVGRDPRPAMSHEVDRAQISFARHRERSLTVGRFGSVNEANLSPIRWRSVVVDCPDPSALATFYGDLLDARVVLDPDWSEVHLEQAPLKLAFQRVEGYAQPEWPNGLPQQLHLDFTVVDLMEASTRAVHLGARVLKEPVDEDGSTYQVHADPFGHPFCLVVEWQT